MYAPAANGIMRDKQTRESHARAWEKSYPSVC